MYAIAFFVVIYAAWNVPLLLMSGP